MIDKKYLTIIFLLMVTVFVSWRFYFCDYRQNDSVYIKNFPVMIGNWTSEELSIDKADLAMLETGTAFLRLYKDNRGNKIYLYLAYSQSSPTATNPPEVFYNGSGISIIDKGKKNLKIFGFDSAFKVNWLLLDNNQNQQIAYYWYKVGGLNTHSYWKQRALAAINNLTGKRRGNSLIRISTDIHNGRQKEAINLINGFACLIIPQLDEQPL